MPQDESFIGISGVKGNLNGNPLKKTRINESIGYVDASNLERKKYGLKADMAEVFFTQKIRFYSFPVWYSEKFVPEAVVWDQMALDGYKLRWYNKVIYLCEYQSDGLTNSSWQLLKNNPMGYAQLFNIQIKTEKRLKKRLYLIIQFISCCCLGKEFGFIKKCHNRAPAIILFPIGWFLSLRRKRQISYYCHA